MTAVRLRLFYAFTFLACSIGATAQGDEQYRIVSGKLNAFSKNFNTTLLYLHLDKSVYVHNENIWFAAYGLSMGKNTDDQKTLYVALCHKLSRTPVLSDKFVMKGGMAFGSLFLPDSLATGDYELVAFTNQVGAGATPDVFHQEVKLRAPEDDPYYLLREQKAGAEFQFLVTKGKSQPAVRTPVVYRLLGEERMILEGKTLTDEKGGFGLPDSLRLYQSVIHRLVATIGPENESFTTQLPLVLDRDLIFLKWYPAGGDLVDGISNRLSCEARDALGRPVEFRGHLLEDQKIVAPVEVNASGAGMIEWTFHTGKAYSVVAQTPSLKLQQVFPEIKENGFGVKIDHPVFRDTLKVLVQRSRPGGFCYLLLHDHRNDYYFAEVGMRTGKMFVRIPAAELPPGLYTLTVFDSAGAPVAEQAVFKKQDTLPHFDLHTDSSRYHHRSKVTLKIRAGDGKGKGIKTSFSLSCVLLKRIDTTSFQQILPYALFHGYQVNVTGRPTSLYTLGSEGDLETFLRINCWTRYRWTDTLVAVKNPFAGVSLEETGYVLKKNKRLIQPVELVVLNGGALNAVTTDDKGAFQLTDELLELPADEKVSLFVNDKARELYSVFLQHPEEGIYRNIAGWAFPELSTVRSFVSLEETGTTRAKKMETVVIRSKTRKDEFFSQRGNAAVFQSRTCNDYVCMNNILNCRNHPYGRKAVDGETYQYLSPNGMKSILYKACAGSASVAAEQEFLYFTRGRYYTKEFYPADYAKFNPPDPELSSTVFWSPQIITSENGEAEVSFYTNDLNGYFICLLEGVTAEGVICGSISFPVGN